MYKIVIGSSSDRMLVLVMKPEDFAAYRAHPLDDMSLIDGNLFGRPDVQIIITYAGGRNQARRRIKENFGSISSATIMDTCVSQASL
jgi:hypothetical protein